MSIDHDIARIEGKLDSIFDKLERQSESFSDMRERITRIETGMNGHYKQPHERPCKELKDHIETQSGFMHLVFDKIGTLLIGILGGIFAWILARMYFKQDISFDFNQQFIGEIIEIIIAGAIGCKLSVLLRWFMK